MEHINEVDKYLDELDDVIENASSVPLAGGRKLVDIETLKAIIDDIRLNMPKEIKQANAIIDERDEIINDAKREADTIIKFSEEKAKAAVAQHKITQTAQANAANIVSQAQQRSKEMRKAAIAFFDDVMSRTDKQLTETLTEVRQTRQSFRTAVKGQKKD